MIADESLLYGENQTLTSRRNYVKTNVRTLVRVRMQ
jgi:hypothetical protein